MTNTRPLPGGHKLSDTSSSIEGANIEEYEDVDGDHREEEEERHSLQAIDDDRPVPRQLLVPNLVANLVQGALNHLQRLLQLVLDRAQVSR